MLLKKDIESRQIYRQSPLVPLFLLCCELVLGGDGSYESRSGLVLAITVMGAIIIIAWGSIAFKHRRLETNGRLKYYGVKGELVLDAGWDDVREFYTSSSRSLPKNQYVMLVTLEGSVNLMGLSRLNLLADTIRELAPEAKVSNDLGTAYRR